MLANVANIFLHWAKPLKRWQMAVLIMLVVSRLVPVWANEHRRVRLPWTIPAQSQLQTDSGRLEPPIRVPAKSRHASDQWIGQVIAAHDHVLEFSCEPGESDLACVYSKRAYGNPLVGQDVTISYFMIPTGRDAAYTTITITPTGAKYSRAPERPMTTLPVVIMEMRTHEKGRDIEVLSYSGSRARLQKYKGALIQIPIFDLITGGLLALAAPGLLYRLATGRSEAPIKAAQPLERA